MNNNNINKPVESSQCRHLRRMNILRERKLGHHQWKGLKLKMMQYRKLQDNKRWQEDKVQHRIVRVQKRDRHWIEQYRDARTSETLTWLINGAFWINLSCPGGVILHRP